jgi:hypothetical protein
VSEVAVTTPGIPGEGKCERREDFESIGESRWGGLCGSGDVMKENGGKEAHDGLSGRGGQRDRISGVCGYLLQ